MNPPPQFGQTLRSTFSTQSPQKVHSKEQIHASALSGGSARLQCSQPGRSSSIAQPSFCCLVISHHDSAPLTMAMAARNSQNPM